MGANTVVVGSRTFMHAWQRKFKKRRERDNWDTKKKKKQEKKLRRRKRVCMNKEEVDDNDEKRGVS